jgi:hypothetical protein
METRSIAIGLVAIVAAFAAAFGLAKSGGSKTETAGAGVKAQSIKVVAPAAVAGVEVGGTIPALKVQRKAPAKKKAKTKKAANTTNPAATSSPSTNNTASPQATAAPKVRVPPSATRAPNPVPNNKPKPQSTPQQSGGEDG